MYLFSLHILQRGDADDWIFQKDDDVDLSCNCDWTDPFVNAQE